MSKIKNAGQLREFLLDAMPKIEAGTMEPDVARNLIKMASQVNESVYAEIKVYKVQMEAGMAIGKMGHLNLTDSE